MKGSEVYISRSPRESVEFGVRFAGRLRPGDVVALCGGLGVGKTVLARGICRGLGYTGEVTSPSFVRVHNYRAGIPIYHVDFYLARSAEDAMDLGLDELFDDEGVVIIEWAQRFPGVVPAGCWLIEMTWPGGGETVREISITRKGDQ